MLFNNKLFNSIACLLSFTNLQLVIPGRTWILLYWGRTVYKRLWACLALYFWQKILTERKNFSQTIIIDLFRYQSELNALPAGCDTIFNLWGICTIRYEGLEPTLSARSGSTDEVFVWCLMSLKMDVLKIGSHSISGRHSNWSVTVSVFAKRLMFISAGRCHSCFTILYLISLTRLHSSRMRTSRALTVSSNLLCGGWGVPALGGGWVPAPGGGHLLLGGCLVPGVAWSQGGLLPGRGYPSMHWGRPPPPVNRITDACKNITLPQLRWGW